jgi:hypothetical protein
MNRFVKETRKWDVEMHLKCFFDRVRSSYRV